VTKDLYIDLCEALGRAATMKEYQDYLADLGDRGDMMRDAEKYDS